MASRTDAGLRALLVAAAFVVIIAGLRAAGPIIVPVLIAVFVAVLSIAPVRYLQKRGVPDLLASVGVFIGVVVTLVLLSIFVGASLRDFDDNLPGYEVQLKASLAGLLSWLESYGLHVDFPEVREALNTDIVVDFAQDLMRATSSVLSNTAFVLLTVAFILAEVASFPRKLRAVVGEDTPAFASYSHFIEDIQTYFTIKTKISLATGVLAVLLVWIVGVDYPLLWGLVAFMLNFVPTLGSIIAAVPVVLLAFVQLGWPQAVVIFGGYAVINVLLGSVIEPRLMGKRLGLSTLVVFLSLVFWGYVFGPAGMLLSVPLTMVAKIFLETSEDLRWLAVLLGPADEVPRHEEAAESRRASVSGRLKVSPASSGESMSAGESSGAGLGRPAADPAPTTVDS